MEDTPGFHTLTPSGDADRRPYGAGAGPAVNGHHATHYIRSLKQIHGLKPQEAERLQAVAQTFAFRANDYYLGLVDWSDPNDPIRQLVIPRTEELEEFGRLDASDEAAYTVVQGLQHKYADTALVLTARTCGAYCRYCFRKRLFMEGNDEVVHDLTPAVEYVRAHPEITDVLLTGGDPLILTTRKLRAIVDRFVSIPHVRVLRLGSKMPAFSPFRLLDDPALHEMFRDVAATGRTPYLMAHFDHPRELTPEAVAGIQAVQVSGAVVVNQCPIIRGVNDDAATLASLFTRMTAVGAPQYYLFQCRPTAGNQPYEMPLVRAWSIFDEARRRTSGLSRRVRFCMSHATGKVEVLGVNDRFIYARYHRAQRPEDESRMLVFHRDDEAYWLDSLRPADR